MIYIYALINPLDDKVFYIGASSYPKQRLSSHLSYRYICNSAKDKKIVEILESGNRIEILIVDECKKEEVRYWEEFYISLFRFYGFDLPQLSKSYYPDGIIRKTKYKTINAQ